MSISRKLVRLWSRLSDHLGSRFVYDEKLVEETRAEPDYLSLQRSLDKKKIDANTAILLAMRSVAMHDQEIRSELASAELSVTFPGGTLSSARPTFQVIRDMLANAKSEVILAGYRVTNWEICELLQLASRRNVAITLIVGCADGDAQKLMDRWPANCPAPKIYVDIPQDDGGLMHIKSIVVDREDLLITSANFTFNAMNKNFEFGVRLRGPQAKEARQVLIDLANSEMFEPYEKR